MQVTVIPVCDASCEQIDEVVLEGDCEEGRSFFFGRNSRPGLYLVFIVAWPTVVVHAQVLNEW